MYPIGTLQQPTSSSPFEVILECCLARAEDGTSIFVILWEFEVKPGVMRALKEPMGSGSNSFNAILASGELYSGGIPSRPLCYFTSDIRDSEAAYNQFPTANEITYAELDRSG